MIVDELTLKRAADSIYGTLRVYLNEPSEANQIEFLTVLRHYTQSGVRIQLLKDGNVIVRGEVTTSRQVGPHA